MRGTFLFLSFMLMALFVYSNAYVLLNTETNEISPTPNLTTLESGFGNLGKVDRIGIVLPATATPTPVVNTKKNDSSSSDSTSNSSSSEAKRGKREVDDDLLGQESHSEEDNSNAANEVELSIEDHETAATDGEFHITR